MSFDTLLALIAFAFVTSVTPGPNNFMLLASGVNFGLVRTLPHMLGIGTGFCSLLLGVGLGLGALLVAFPVLETVLKVAGGSYLLYLAWRIATSRSMGNGEADAARPMRFLEAAAFQWVNPKVWVMAISAMALYTNADRPVLSVLLVALVFPVTGFPATSAWAVFGRMLKGWLSDPARLKVFNIAMGLMLAATLVPLLR